MSNYDIDKMDTPWVVKEVRDLTDATYVLQFSRNGMNFKPGQHLVAGMINSTDLREYSIYSGINDEYLEILVREVEDGAVSKKLRKLQPGNVLEIKGPYGFFMYNTQPPEFRKFVFIASGTGIAPFRSFVRSFPRADYRIIHGIRTIDEAYGKNDFREDRYLTCTSKDDKGDFTGRLTDYLKTADLEKDAMIYLCGNSNMILDAMEIMEGRGHSQSRMFTEVYF